MKFNENLAIIHAYLCADGYVIKNPITQKNKYYYIGFRNTNLVLLKDFQKRFFSYFKIKPRLNVGERCIVQKKELYEKLIKDFNSFYSREWAMPSLNNKLSKKWLRAFFDCEGWVVCKSHQNRHIGLDSVNEKGLEQVKAALKKLKIASQIKKRNDRDIFSMHIYGKENLINFKRKINFLHPDKKGKLKEAVEDYVNHYWGFPKENGKLKRFVREIMLKKAKIKKPCGLVRVISNKEENLMKLQKELINFFNIESKLNKRINSIGTIYFELNVNKKSEAKKVILNGLINRKGKEKWSNSKK